MTRPHPDMAQIDANLSRGLEIPPDIDRLRNRARVALAIVAAVAFGLVAGIVLTKAIANAAAMRVAE